MPSLPRCTALGLCPEREADDVAFVPGEKGTALVAWSTATLASERVVVSRWSGKTFGVPIPLLAPGDTTRVFRPAVGTIGSTGLLLGCVRTSDGFRPVGMLLPPSGEPVRFALEAKGDVFQVAVASRPGRERGWVAWEERVGRRSDLRVGLLDKKGRFEEAALPGGPAPDDRYRRSPVLVAGKEERWLCWVEGRVGGPGHVMIAGLGKEGADPIRVDPHPAHQEAPSACVLPGGGIAVAWHTQARGDGDAIDVTRWVRAAVLLPSGELSLHRLEPETVTQQDAGEDQAWEFPAVAAEPDGTLWIAGRSSHGYHVAFFDGGEWSDQVSVSEPFWGGRGRRLSLAYVPDRGVVFARREPDGISLSLLERPAAPAGAEPPIPRAPTDPAVPHAPPGSLDPTRPLSVVAAPSRKEAKVLFGDLHQHTAHSDGVGSAEELYLLARDRRDLDFAAVTDHDRFCRRALGPATWQYLRHVAQAFHEPGRFVTFAAYEFTGPRFPGPGHKCVYFGDSVPERVPDKDLDEIFRVLHDHGGLCAPHHVGWTGADMEHHDPKLQPVWEVCSVHGCYEQQGADVKFPPRQDPALPGQFIKDALDAGLRFGFIGSTDSHGLLWHHGISPKRDPFSTGLAGVVGATLERDSLLVALKARRCYATTGAKILMDVELGGAPMGAELPADTTGELSVRVTGTSALSRVVLCRAGGETILEGIEQNRLSAAVPVAADPTRPWDYMYVRVEQADGELAWSSPIWIG